MCLLFVAAGALAIAAPVTNGYSSEVKTYAYTIANEAEQLEAITAMQNLDYRSHQVHLEELRAAVNGLGKELAGTPDNAAIESAREVASLLTQAIETLNETQSALLPTGYRETVKKLSVAADRLQREVKTVKSAHE